MFFSFGGLQNLYTNISVKDVLELLNRLFFKYQHIVPNALLIIELMELVLNSAVMKFQKDLFKQILGTVMGTNLALILANIYGYAGRGVNNNLQNK